MATQTLHYHLTKPASADRVAVGDLNDNSDTIDGYLYKANERADQLADDYNPSSTYNTDDYVRRENYIYKCNTDNTTGTWDDTKWDRVKVMNEITQGGGGGSSTLAGLDDVNISSPTDWQALVYDNATQKWVNSAGGGGSSTFAGLNDVNVQGVSNGDIARYNSTTGKWTDSSDLTDLELSVSQLSSSVLNIAGDVDTLELTVSQLSASKLPYDANKSTKQKIDEVDNKIGFEMENYSLGNFAGTIIRMGRLRIIQLYNSTDEQPAISGTLASKDKPDRYVRAGGWLQASKSAGFSSRYLQIDTNGNISTSSTVFRGGWILAYITAE